MLVIQVAVYFMFFTPSGITYIMVTFIPSLNTTYYNTIRTLTVVWQQGGFFIAFFFYILTGKIYRQELEKMLKYDQIRTRMRRMNNQRPVTTHQPNTTPAFAT
ncbi:unnamed protein product [Adineta ricciae]|uniref:Uncharacterized protein n=1 Tax=Adineta ricciae TaxID=249248 RepID=A0A815V9G4_ADIRI|nr:unnamed protein product [Adineta ricciae]